MVVAAAVGIWADGLGLGGGAGGGGPLACSQGGGVGGAGRLEKCVGLCGAISKSQNQGLRDIWVFQFKSM